MYKTKRIIPILTTSTLAACLLLSTCFPVIGRAGEVAVDDYVAAAMAAAEEAAQIAGSVIQEYEVDPSISAALEMSNSILNTLSDEYSNMGGEQSHVADAPSDEELDQVILELLSSENLQSSLANLSDAQLDQVRLRYTETHQRHDGGAAAADPFVGTLAAESARRVADSNANIDISFNGQQGNNTWSGITLSNGNTWNADGTVSSYNYPTATTSNYNIDLTRYLDAGAGANTSTSYNYPSGTASGYSYDWSSYLGTLTDSIAGGTYNYPEGAMTGYNYDYSSYLNSAANSQQSSTYSMPSATPDPVGRVADAETDQKPEKVIPRTGDTSDAWLWIMLSVVAMGTIGWAIQRLIRKEER